MPWLKISLLSVVILGFLVLPQAALAQDDDIDSTDDEEQIIPQSAQGPQTQPLIIDDSDSNDASEVEYEE